MNSNIKKVDDDLRGRERKNLHMTDTKKKANRQFLSRYAPHMRLF